MIAKKNKIRVGIIGCGAIGSRIAASVQNDLKNACHLSGLFDIDADKVMGVQCVDGVCGSVGVCAGWFERVMVPLEEGCESGFDAARADHDAGQSESVVERGLSWAG